MDRITAAEVFVQIAERGSMAAAAQALDMSRAMVTRYLAQMESWSGARLLHRTTRRLSLTPAGDQTLARCRQLLEIAEGVAVTDTDSADPVRGLLRVASSQTLAQMVLAGVVHRFLQRHPQAAIDLRIDARAVNLVEERIDLAIRITNDLDPNLIARRLGDCDSVLCASPAYVAAHGLPASPADLALHHCLTYTYFGRSLWEFTDAQGERISVPVGGTLSANESQVLLAASVEGTGISMQPAFAAAPWLVSGALVQLLPAFRPQSLGIHAVFATRRQMTPALRAMVEMLAAHFADPAHWPPRLGPAVAGPSSRAGPTPAARGPRGGRAARQAAG
ncbi:MAG: LysR family transcriptional regulator [Comamonadaceae bacterium]|nr:MAG: LysR family transcriptional regulator [Comamonadaceae bacterium]